MISGPRRECALMHGWSVRWCMQADGRGMEEHPMVVNTCVASFSLVGMIIEAAIMLAGGQKEAGPHHQPTCLQRPTITAKGELP